MAEIRLAKQEDAAAIAAINEKNFTGHADNVVKATEWVEGWLSCPHFRCFVAHVDDKLAGYIIWQVRGGLLLPTPEVELVQLGLAKDIEKSELGMELMKKTSREVIEWLAEGNRRIDGHFIFYVAIRTGEATTALYREFFGEQAGQRLLYNGKNDSFLKCRLPRFKFG